MPQWVLLKPLVENLSIGAYNIMTSDNTTNVALGILKKHLESNQLTIHEMKMPKRQLNLMMMMMMMILLAICRVVEFKEGSDAANFIDAEELKYKDKTFPFRNS